VSTAPVSLRSRVAVLVMQLAIVALLLAAWEYSAGRYVDELLVSRPSAIWRRFLVLWSSGRVIQATMDTTTVALWGLFWGTLAGAGAGVLAALSRRAYAVLGPVFDALFAVPKIALVPLFILWFGISATQRTIFTASVVFFFIFYATYNGVKRVPRSLENTLRLLDASVVDRLRLLYLPASLGWILGGMRIATPYAFVSAVSAEIVASREGLGSFVKLSGSMLDIPGMFVGIVAATAVAVCSGAIIASIDGMWHRRL
jgi:NitT/TauT family transport system permease protein